MHDLWASQVVLVVKNPAANLGDIRDMGMISELRRSPGGGQANHSSILGWRISLDRGAWRATVHRAAKSWTWLSWFSTQEHAWFVSSSHSWYYKILPQVAFLILLPIAVLVSDYVCDCWEEPLPSTHIMQIFLIPLPYPNSHRYPPGWPFSISIMYIFWVL